MSESAKEEWPAKQTKREWPKSLVENLQCQEMEAKDSISRRKCSTDLNAAQN